MVYTKARLEHALKVFRRRKSLKDTQLHGHLERELRRTTRSARTSTFQRWTFSGAQENSDEDEYDPREERRQLNAARRKKKEAAEKRKSTDVGDQERVVKKQKKGEATPHQVGGAAYVVLRLTDPKYRSKLEELSRDHKTRLESSDHKSRGPERRSSEEDTSGVEQHRIDVFRRNDSSGAELRHIDEDVDNNVKKRQLLSGTMNDIPKHNEVLHEKIESNDPLDSPLAAQIQIDPSDDHRSEERSSATPQTRSIQASPNSDSLLTSQPAPPPISSLRTSTIERFDTSYAHPINFKLIPGRAGQPACDFCKDWTFGVLGYGVRHITAIRDPKNPLQYQEIANGHRDEGRSPTQMCIKCSLQRLLMMRCHSPTHQATRPLEINTLNQPFERVHARDITGPQSFKYLKHLFARMNGERDLIAATFEVPACNLCPQPASWKCCKWQQRDHARRPCRVPNVDRSTEAEANLPAIHRQSSTNSSLGNEISRRFGTSMSQNRQQSKEPVIISLLDSSDDDDDQPFSGTKTDTSRRLPVSTPPATRLQPPLRSCGLHLCKTCHTFITQSCGSFLPEKKVLEYLDGTRFGRRADVSWLLTGSLLERCYEDGRGC